MKSAGLRSNSERDWLLLLLLDDEDDVNEGGPPRVNPAKSSIGKVEEGDSAASKSKSMRLTASTFGFDEPAITPNLFDTPGYLVMSMAKELTREEAIR